MRVLGMNHDTRHGGTIVRLRAVDRCRRIALLVAVIAALVAAALLTSGSAAAEPDDDDELTCPLLLTPADTDLDGELDTCVSLLPTSDCTGDDGDCVKDAIYCIALAGVVPVDTNLDGVTDACWNSFGADGKRPPGCAGEAPYALVDTNDDQIADTCEVGDVECETVAVSLVAVDTDGDGYDDRCLSCAWPAQGAMQYVDTDSDGAVDTCRLDAVARVRGARAAASPPPAPAPPPPAPAPPAPAPVPVAYYPTYPSNPCTGTNCGFGSPPPSPRPKPAPVPLAHTGSSIAPVVTVASSLVLVGTLAVIAVARRRRRVAQHLLDL